jgi:hypothetical protein
MYLLLAYIKSSLIFTNIEGRSAISDVETQLGAPASLW